MNHRIAHTSIKTWIKGIVFHLITGLSLWISPAALFAQSTGTSNVPPNSIETPRLFDPSNNTTNPSALSVQSQNPFLGSVPGGQADGSPLHLTLKQAIAMALRANLGLIDSNVGDDVARARHLRALSVVLPQLMAESQIALQTYDLSTIGASNLKLPNRDGPFNYGNASVSLRQQVLDMSAIHTIRERAQEEQASAETLRDARNIVVLAATSAYLAAASDGSRVSAAQAELDAAKATAQLLRDRVDRELSPEIDSIRSDVAEETAQQRLTLITVHTEEDKLALGRIIGVPANTSIVIDDTLDFSALPTTDAGDLETEATTHRADFAAAKRREAAEGEHVQAATSERLPTINVAASFGGGGKNLGAFYDQYSVQANLQVPIFTGGRIKSDIQEARAERTRAQSETQDLHQRILFDIRTAQLNLAGAATSVSVAQKNLALAERGLKQSKDRFEAGMTLAQEVLDSQQAVADAKDNYIRSVYEHNLAKLMLIRATGTAEEQVGQYISVRQAGKQ
jgi:outer membrane protein TolC